MQSQQDAEFLLDMPAAVKEQLATQGASDYKTAIEFHDAGNLEGAIASYQQALEKFKAINALNKDIFICHRNIAMCYMDLAEVNTTNKALQTEQVTNSKKHFEAAIKLYTTRLEIGIGMQGVSTRDKHMQLEYCYSRLTQLYKYDNTDEALHHAYKALDSAKEVYSKQPERIAICLNNIAACYSVKKDYAETIHYIEEALKIYRKLQIVNIVQELEKTKQDLTEMLGNQGPKVSFSVCVTPTKAAKPTQSTNITYDYGKSNLYPEESKQELSSPRGSTSESLSPLPSPRGTFSSSPSPSPRGALSIIGFMSTARAASAPVPGNVSSLSREASAPAAVDVSITQTSEANKQRQRTLTGS